MNYLDEYKKMLNHQKECQVKSGITTCEDCGYMYSCLHFEYLDSIEAQIKEAVEVGLNRVEIVSHSDFKWVKPIDWDKPLEMRIFSNGEINHDFVDVRKVGEKKLYSVSHGTEHADYLYKKSGRYLIGYSSVTEQGEVLDIMDNKIHIVGEVRNKEKTK